MSKHTPTLPWHRSLHPIKSPKVGYNLHDNSGNPCKIRILTNDIAVAYYVADACNAHDELVSFVRWAAQTKCINGGEGAVYCPHCQASALLAEMGGAS